MSLTYNILSGNSSVRLTFQNTFLVKMFLVCIIENDLAFPYLLFLQAIVNCVNVKSGIMVPIFYMPGVIPAFATFNQRGSADIIKVII